MLIDSSGYSETYISVIQFIIARSVSEPSVRKFAVRFLSKSSSTLYCSFKHKLLRLHAGEYLTYKSFHTNIPCSFHIVYPRYKIIIYLLVNHLYICSQKIFFSDDAPYLIIIIIREI